ncbi:MULTISPECIES: gephyrin-like molybdotransferase Glp [unclassified Aureimonas]|uniref:molybdopterin molybdotransferase MoeA n=1 Tax=unclassified Aureimonas TaxID=2615206 RepID=UPI00070037A2|nr:MULTISPECIES: gephyrin-like molybdotransferase Glp [unclassified Aureimonas]KQT60324.1 molybdenum cofactor biosynthesis protein MoaA [Aureimonas sp. Leaf427]KQT79200.1 molybdenum cofactor biosynthesis protein MoaA [Aureimonas sp. Leaf460]
MSLLSVEDAFERLTHGVEPVGRTQSVELRSAHGRVLAADLLATRTQPDFDASAMDGYALRAEDVRAPFQPLRLIGESAAGRAFEGRIGAGEAVRIFTGAPVPPGADAILIQENAERPAPGLVLPTEPVLAGRHIRRAGADFSRGDTLVLKGKRLTSGAIALAASGGHPRLDVIARPRVAILATGDELVLPGSPVGPSQIVASNTFGVAAMVEDAGAEVLDYGIARDDEAEIAGRIDRAIADGADILVTIGGASVGDHDLVGKVFAAKNVELDFWKVAMRPGKPLMAGRLGPMRLIGLPGNPASSMVAATLFLKPLVAALAGRPERTIYRDGILGADMPENDLRADFIRSTIDEASAVRPIVNPAGRQDSSLLSVYARADVLLLRPPHAPAAKAGDACRFVRLD